MLYNLKIHYLSLYVLIYYIYNKVYLYIVFYINDSIKIIIATIYKQC